MSGCASIPEEAVTLSYTVGKDIAAIQTSYDTLIQQYFDSLRQQRIDYVNNVWKPKFVQNWVTIGKLKEVASGQLVWDDSANGGKGGFVAPPSDAAKANTMMLETIVEWSSQALRKIAEKQTALIQPLDQQEAELRADVTSAFNRLVRANSFVTAELNSLRELKSAQDEALEVLGIKDTTDKITSRLIQISDSAALGLQKVKAADGFVDEVTDAAATLEDAINQ